MKDLQSLITRQREAVTALQSHVDASAKAYGDARTAYEEHSGMLTAFQDVLTALEKEQAALKASEPGAPLIRDNVTI